MRKREEGLDIGTHVERTRRLVMRRHGHLIARSGADPDDVMQDVYVRLVAAQQSPRARYDASRGMRPTTYLTMVGGCAALNALRHHRRRYPEVLEVYPIKRENDDEADEWDIDPDAIQGTGPEFAMERILSLLDLDEEREMARHLAAGCAVTEIMERMGLNRVEADELRDRVRALLMVLRDDL